MVGDRSDPVGGPGVDNLIIINWADYATYHFVVYLDTNCERIYLICNI